MSQDIVADALNQMMNALRARQTSVTLKRHSKLLLSVLAIAKLKGYVKSYKVDGTSLLVEFDKLNACNSIKPRFTISVSDIDKYVKRYLPAREIGILIVSTNQGLMTHQTAQDKNLGGSLIAYMY
jgi:small subunit ribosomal protein S8